MSSWRCWSLLVTLLISLAGCASADQRRPTSSAGPAVGGPETPLATQPAAATATMAGEPVLTMPPARETATMSGNAVYQLVARDGFELAILPEAQAPALLAGTGWTASYWTPGEQDVLAFMRGLEPYLRDNPDRRSPQLWQKLADYRGQFAGFVRDGARLIYGSFFCDVIDWDDWLSRPVQVEDGGDCFFQIVYDPLSQRFSDLYINGEA